MYVDGDMPYDGYEKRFDAPELPSDCEREPVDRRPVYWTDGLGYFVMDDPHITSASQWIYVLTVAATFSNSEWAVRDRGMANLDALPYFRTVVEDAVIIGA